MGGGGRRRAAALPSFSSVTQGNNANFLPASAPSEQALQLAGSLGASTLAPVPVVAASAQGPLTPADQAWLSRCSMTSARCPPSRRYVTSATRQPSRSPQLSRPPLASQSWPC